MITYSQVRSAVKPAEMEIDAYGVWINSNIEQVEVNFGTMDDNDEELIVQEYVFDQIYYTKNEYIEILSNKNAELESSILDTQSALCDIYESIGGDE